MLFFIHSDAGGARTIRVPCFDRKELRGKLALAITANFKNYNTRDEAAVDEISGVAFIFNQKFFKVLVYTCACCLLMQRQEYCSLAALRVLATVIVILIALTHSVSIHDGFFPLALFSIPQELNAETGIDLENIVYYKDDTHYFVMTAKKESLLKKGVLKAVRILQNDFSFLGDDNYP